MTLDAIKAKRVRWLRVRWTPWHWMSPTNSYTTLCGISLPNDVEIETDDAIPVDAESCRECLARCSGEQRVVNDLYCRSMLLLPNVNGSGLPCQRHHGHIGKHAYMRQDSDERIEWSDMDSNFKTLAEEPCGNVLTHGPEGKPCACNLTKGHSGRHVHQIKRPGDGGGSFSWPQEYDVTTLHPGGQVDSKGDVRLAGIRQDYPSSGNYVTEAVNHPAHYGGADNPYEAIKVIEAWGANFNVGTVLKYLARHGKKNAPTFNHTREDSALHPCELCRKGMEVRVEDLLKARWYLNREIENLKKEQR